MFANPLWCFARFEIAHRLSYINLAHHVSLTAISFLTLPFQLPHRRNDQHLTWKVVGLPLSAAVVLTVVTMALCGVWNWATIHDLPRLPPARRRS
jgi:hypothetical protein